MAKRVERVTAGFDVSLDKLDVYRRDTDELVTIDNNEAAIRQYFKTLPLAQIAVEPTNSYHQLLVQIAVELGHEVYMVDPYQLNKYREATGTRAKTDPGDARLLSRFLEREGSDLTPYRAVSKQGQELLLLLNRRALIVKHKTSLRVGLRDLPAKLRRSEQALMRHFDRLIELIDKRMQELIDTLGYRADFNRVKGIKGFGDLNATALVALYHQHTFVRADQFIAFMGIDVRVRESGRHKGKRKMTKKGPSEIRRLLYMGGKSAANSSWLKALYERLQKEGKAKIAAINIIARKLARIAFSLMKNQREFSLEHHNYA